MFALKRKEVPMSISTVAALESSRASNGGNLVASVGAVVAIMLAVGLLISLAISGAHDMAAYATETSLFYGP